MPRPNCVVRSRKHSLECYRAKALRWRLHMRRETNCDNPRWLNEYECLLCVLQSAAIVRTEHAFVSWQSESSESIDSLLHAGFAKPQRGRREAQATYISSTSAILTRLGEG